MWDLMVDVMFRCYEEGLYSVILLVYDELIVECDMD